MLRLIMNVIDKLRSKPNEKLKTDIKKQRIRKRNERYKANLRGKLERLKKLEEKEIRAKEYRRNYYQRKMANLTPDEIIAYRERISAISRKRYSAKKDEKREKTNERERIRYHKNKEAIKAKKKAYYRENREAILRKKREKREALKKNKINS